MFLTMRQIWRYTWSVDTDTGLWIHEHQDWPNFTWDAERLASKLPAVRHHQGHLLGRMEGLGFELQREARLRSLTSEVVHSAAIEGENLSRQEVRSSFARRLGIDTPGLIPAGRDVDGIVEVTLDATQQWSEPLTKTRLFNWHAALFTVGHSGMRPITVGAWRTEAAGPMQVVSGPLGREHVHFEAPSADRIDQEMQTFLEWFNADLGVDPVLKAGIAHLWFVTIHPFEDGNGRIGRAVADMALARADGTQNRYYSLSSQMEAERNDYYTQLERQQRGTPNVTGWLAWFLDCLDRAIFSSTTTLSNVLFKAQLWDRINARPVNDRQRLIINRMLEDDFEGHMNTSKYAKLAKCSPDTALRDISELKGRGILIKNAGGGRSTSYRLPESRDIVPPV